MTSEVQLFFFIIANIMIFFLLIKNINIFYKKRILIDYPDQNRKLHKKPTPLIGGILIANYLILVLIFQIEFNQITMATDLLIVIPLIIFIVGILDDIFFINAYAKLLIICLIFAIPVFLSDQFLIQTIYFASFNKLIHFNKFSFFITILCLALLINAFNLSDGINGLATGLAIIWLIYLLIISNAKLAYLLLPLLILLIIIFYYIYAGKFFLGDNGSLLLASLIGLLTINIYNTNLENKNLIPVENIFIIFMLPGIDMLRLFIFRIYKKEDPFFPDRDHLHHKLNKKYNLKKSLFIYFSIIIFFILLNHSNIIKPFYIIILFVFFYIFLLKKLNKGKFI